ncbi:hypothetical protein GGH94_002514 [Coemansia aciculifera]|uniref:Uncharacterized protein n=1 Tax=Coemansia aciculifera TaxID=417176 RepID=A0A9W8IL25_9FUNG|nr:hypothetical protein GGH94_002514 [Coemansia aciculifera]KAJ2874784.1 hypothetical protein GGH93_002143 [Coemansia aciculifera]
MRVPFFRSKAKTDSDDIKHSLRAKKGGLAVGVLDGIASESELSSYAPATPMSSAGNVTRAALSKPGATTGAVAATQTARAIADQVGEMEAFLATIDGFQGEARRLFPENMALDQILGELRDECRRRVDYMTRVSAPPAWMAHQRQSSSSSTIIAPSSAATTRRATQSNPASGAAQVRSRSATGYGGIDSSPISTATATSSSGSSSGSSHSTGRRNQHSSSFAENKNNDGAAGYFSRHQPANTARKALGAGSPPSSPTQSPSLPPSQTVGRRDARVADQRRKTAPQSMIVAGSVGDIAATRATAAAANRAATSHAATMPKPPRASIALPSLDSPRFTKPRTSSIDNFGRPLSFADASDANFHVGALSINAGSSPAQLAAKGSLGAMRAAPVSGNAAGGGQAKPKQQQQQHMPSHSGKIAGEYVFNVKLAGHKIETAVSSSLQTSLISLQLAKIMGMHIVSVPNNSRVWSSGGKSWPVMGEVVGLPFVCGNMTFTHSFKIVQGSAGTNDMTRDIMLGNDFCVCNHGRIKDDKLHLEQLSMPITVPVRQIPAN